MLDTRLIDLDEPRLRAYFSTLANVLEKMMLKRPDGKTPCGFALLVFDEPGLCQYVSNCDRGDVIRALRESADQIEKNQDIPREGV